MTDDAETGERIDPRYDPAFQRGFGGGVQRLRTDERAFARPGTGAAAPTGSAAPGAPSAPARRAAPVPADQAGSRRSRRIGEEPPLAPTEPQASSPDVPVSGAPAREAPLLRNPWLLVLLAAGLVGTVLGLVLLSAGYSSPPPPYYGDSDVPQPEWIQRQLLYYSCIPLLGCLPGSILIAIGVAALRWRGVPAPRSAGESPEQAALLVAEPQTPEAPKSSPSR
ncbi:hypothetical protein [Rathayibacter tanaceti]|uniref:Uncharacterized protein n=2 Tax=Rathayibacter tanaceti TaxID=1671680 RepID=A0A162FXM7_9MICO|nr:hypothetical protein [Rathayibacter tanaceti]KZX21050.1 hypothetical protein ACH61_01834 [Rathayibacter tanaceti]QHC56335.1 hypothetical protein GSU10_12295 [Rathayibacter tanaceti]TCO34858.1 hypothetical protein EV639_11012 [Rathayibacter tanaceti]